jgi:predicted 3-demethylubiquinone-9 3-methyltransferase (glyoxalase superfamily)
MQKIVPFLWFEDRAEEAIRFYTSIFANSKIIKIDHIPEGPGKGNVVGTFQLEGQEFMALDGGPYFKFSPAISLSVACESREEIDRLWKQLSEGGAVLMPLDAYPFSERFGWLADRFGLSWQLNLVPSTQKIAPSFLFVGEQHGKAEEAMNLYTSVFKDSRITNMIRYGANESDPEGTVKHATFTLAGQQFMAMESALAHQFTFTGGVSMFVNCATQDEVDTLWEKLSEGGEILQCGWLKDRYGIYWQIIPTVLMKMIYGSEPEKSTRAINAMLQMQKIDIKTLQDAFEGAEPVRS